MDPNHPLVPPVVTKLNSTSSFGSSSPGMVVAFCSNCPCDALECSFRTFQLVNRLVLMIFYDKLCLFQWLEWLFSLGWNCVSPTANVPKPSPHISPKFTEKLDSFSWDVPISHTLHSTSAFTSCPVVQWSHLSCFSPKSCMGAFEATFPCPLSKPAFYLFTHFLPSHQHFLK